MRRKDLTGQRFGRLIAKEPTEKRYRGQVVWSCSCDCGAVVEIPGHSLTSGNTNSCGCFRKDEGRKLGNSSKKHGEAGNTKNRKVGTPEYNTWAQMLSRCRNPKVKVYPHYGGRGIAVCARWLSYESFLADMGRRPSDEHSLDRIDNEGNYEPKNCRWATRIIQNNNTRRTRYVEIGGVRRKLGEWLRVYEITPGMFYQRTRRGMTEQEALTTPRLPPGRKTS